MTPRLLSAAITVALLAAPVGAAFAADADSERTTDLDTVNVIAKLEAARNALSPDIGSSQFAITADDIDRLPLGAATPLNQVLLQAPGVVQDSYGSIHVRGDHANLQYRINGVMIPESISGFGQSLEPRIIKNLKLLDGALPAQFGDRTAAVVDITTKSGAELGNGGSVGITAGSFGTINPNASLWGSSGRWSWFVSGDYDQNKNGLENPVDSLNPIHDKSHQGKGFADLTYLVNENTRLSLLVATPTTASRSPTIPGRRLRSIIWAPPISIRRAWTKSSAKTPASALWPCKAPSATPTIRSPPASVTAASPSRPTSPAI